MPSPSPQTVRGIDSFLDFCVADEVKPDSNERHSSDEGDEADEVEEVYEISTVAKKEEDIGIDGELQLQVAQECFENGLKFWTDAEFSKAMADFTRALEIREEVRGRLHDDTANCYMWVATIHLHLKEYEKTLDNLSRCYRIKLALMDKTEHGPGVTRNWINRALELNNVKDTEKYWADLNTCIKHETDGDDLQENNKFEDAIVKYRDSMMLEYSRRGLDCNNPARSITDIADISCKIARAETKLGLHQRALLDYREALSIYMSNFGRHQRYSIQTYNEIAEVAELMGYQKPKIDDYLSTIFDSVRHEKMGDMLALDKNVGKALEEYKEALALEERGIGKWCTPAAVLYYKIGESQTALGQKNAAFLSYCKSVGVLDDVLGARHRLTVETKKKLGVVELADPSPQETGLQTSLMSLLLYITDSGSFCS